MASGTSSKKRKKVSRATSSSRSIHSDASAVFHHKSFKRSYREDYVRELNVPGMMYHILYAFKLIFKNYKSWQIIAKFDGYKSGHALNNQLLRNVQSDPTSYEIVTFNNALECPISYVNVT